MAKYNISKEDAANRLKGRMDDLGIPQKLDNPQLLSKVIYQLFNLAQ